MTTGEFVRGTSKASIEPDTKPFSRSTLWMVTLTRHSSASFNRTEEFGSEAAAGAAARFVLGLGFSVRTGEVTAFIVGNGTLVAAEAKAVARAEGLVIGEAG